MKLLKRNLKTIILKNEEKTIIKVIDVHIHNVRKKNNI